MTENLETLTGIYKLLFMYSRTIVIVGLRCDDYTYNFTLVFRI